MTAGPIHRLGLHPARWEDCPRVIGSRQAIAAMLGRHPDQIKRWGQPVACDVKTRTPLYDGDEMAEIMATRRRRLRAA